VREILGHCTCPSQFPMVKISEGKYKVGDSNALIFVRVLRSHVMVRVGGGWDTLEHYLDKHDPCRCNSFSEAVGGLGSRETGYSSIPFLLQIPISPTHVSPVCSFPGHRLTQTRGVGFSPQKVMSPGSPLAASPSTQRRAEATGLHKPPEALRGGDRRLATRGDSGHAKTSRSGHLARGSGDPTAPRPAPNPTTRHEGPPARPGPSVSPLRGSTAHRDASDLRVSNIGRPPRARRLSGDSDSSASSVQSGTLGRRCAEEGNLTLRKEPGRRFAEGAGPQAHAGPKRQPGSRSQSRERGGLPRPSLGAKGTEADERGRPRLPNGSGKPLPQSPRPRARSQGRTAGEAVLVISRGKDGQHSWARAAEPRENGGGSGRATPRTKSPARGHLTPVGSRSPALSTRRGSLPAAKMDASARGHSPGSLAGPRRAPREPHPGESPHAKQTSDTLGQELEELARTFRTPLRLDPSQEQQLYRRLEEEFLANSEMMGLQEDEEPEPVEPLGRPCDCPRLLQTTPDQGAADSAYCSSSSSSSSLNFFSKYGFQPEPKDESKRSPAPQRPWASDTGAAPAEAHNGSADPSDLWDTPPGLERATRWRRPVLSSSSEESNCYAGLNDLQEVQEGAEPAEPLGDGLWGAAELAAPNGDSEAAPHEEELLAEPLGGSASEEVVLRPRLSLKKPDRVPSIYKLKLRPLVKPRVDSQPDKKPSKIPTPLSYRAAGASKPPAGGASPKDSPAKRPLEQRAWAAFHNVFASLVDSPRSPAESGVSDEGAWA
ncbi:hypothetical protein lerEdw1_019340, partial [Lerista edwardsae]